MGNKQQKNTIENIEAPAVSPRYGKRSVSRADLIRIYSEYGKNGLLQCAAAAGFYEIKDTQDKKHEKKPMSESSRIAQGREDFENTQEQKKKKSLKNAPLIDFWMPASYKETPEAEEKAMPDDIKAAVPFKRDNSEIKGDDTIKPPETRPLIPWPKMWPFLFNVLSLPKVMSKVNEKEAIRRIASGVPLRSLPFQEKRTWAQTAQIILDYNHHLTPLWDEISKLFSSIRKIRGAFGLEALKTECLPEGPYRNKGTGFRYSIPEQGAPLFVISDLGYYDTSGRRMSAWIRFGRRLGIAGLKPVVLMPCPERMWDTRLTRYFFHVCWDRGLRALAICHKDRVQVKSQKYEDAVYTESKERLLSLISPALAVEPGLLRELRYQLPVDTSDIGAEIAVWNSEKVSNGPLHCEMKTEYLNVYRSRFREEEGLKERAVLHIKEHHQHNPWPVRAMEERIAGYLGCCVSSDNKEYMRRHIKTLDDENYPCKDGMTDFINRIIPRMCAEMGGYDKDLAICWVKSNKKALQEGTLEEIPHWVNIKDIAWILAEKLSPERWIILQKGDTLFLKKFDVFLQEAENHGQEGIPAPGSPITTITVSRRLVTIKSKEYKSGYFENEFMGMSNDPLMKEKVRAIYVGNVNSISCPSSDAREFTFETDHESVTVVKRKKGEKAYAIGRDRYGLYEDIAIKGIIQRFRYIPPGRFLMGSPVNEMKRNKDETLHEVILTQGFWLAETACTQELWGAVMGDNPSEFKGGKRPVENVSWETSKEFLESINRREPGLNLRLPTEAEWEYACRAGTTTPFSFGENITPSQVNYDGNYPYKGDKKGEYREKTVEVKALPCNDWGLYEMHGNVWEWCEDWYGKYPAGKLIDPKGAEKGAGRVLRGGSWYFNGRLVRSASRYWFDPGYRHDYVGFRLARGQ